MPNTSPAWTSRSKSATVVTPRSSSTQSWLTSSTASPGVAGALSMVNDTSRPTMSVASDCWVARLRIGGADHLAAAEHDDLVGDGEHLTELVGDEDDRLALVHQAADDAEELVDLAGGEDRGGLVEDQDVGLAGRAP